MQDDGEIAKELLSYTEAEVKLLPWRLQLARSVLLAARDPRQAGLLLEQVGDRLEGRPVQKLRHELPHKTVFYRQGEPVPAEVVAAQAAAASADNGRSVSSHHGPDACVHSLVPGPPSCCRAWGGLPARDAHPGSWRAGAAE
jgi:hypothetical protein